MNGWCIVVGFLYVGLAAALLRGSWERKREQEPDFKGWWFNR